MKQTPKTRLLAWLLTICMVVSMVPIMAVTASADAGVTANTDKKLSYYSNGMTLFGNLGWSFEQNAYPITFAGGTSILLNGVVASTTQSVTILHYRDSGNTNYRVLFFVYTGGSQENLGSYAMQENGSGTPNYSGFDTTGSGVDSSNCQVNIPNSADELYVTADGYIYYNFDKKIGSSQGETPYYLTTNGFKDTIPNDDTAVKLEVSQLVDPNAPSGITTEQALIAAIDSAASGDTIALDGNITLTTTLTIGSGKNIILDLNGKTLTGPDSDDAILNQGTLTVMDSDTDEAGQLIGKKSGITNEGTLTVNSGKITAESDSAISNKGTATVNDGTLTGVSAGINQPSGTSGVLTVTGGTISGNNGIIDDSDNSSNAVTTTITGGVITGTDNQGFGLKQWDGAVKTAISGGTITGNVQAGVLAAGTLTVSDGTISGGKNGIEIADNSSANVTVSGGSITGTNYAIYDQSTSTTGSITAGTLTSSAPLSNWIGALGSDQNKGGNWTIATTGDVYFKCTSASEYAPDNFIWSETLTYVTSVGYEPVAEQENTYKVVAPVANANIVTTADELSSAIADADGETTITIGQDITLTSTLTIESGKDIILDLCGKTISGDVNGALISNAGELKVINSAETVGTISNTSTTSNSDCAISSTGTLEIDGDELEDSQDKYDIVISNKTSQPISNASESSTVTIDCATLMGGYGGLYVAESTATNVIKNADIIIQNTSGTRWGIHGGTWDVEPETVTITDKGDGADNFSASANNATLLNGVDFKAGEDDNSNVYTSVVTKQVLIWSVNPAGYGTGSATAVENAFEKAGATVTTILNTSGTAQDLGSDIPLYNGDKAIYDLIWIHMPNFGSDPYTDYIAYEVLQTYLNLGKRVVIQSEIGMNGTLTVDDNTKLSTLAAQLGGDFTILGQSDQNTTDNEMTLNNASYLVNNVNVNDFDHTNGGYYIPGVTVGGARGLIVARSSSGIPMIVDQVAGVKGGNMNGRLTLITDINFYTTAESSSGYYNVLKGNSVPTFFKNLLNEDINNNNFGSSMVATAEQLKDAIAAGGTIELTADIDVDASIMPQDGIDKAVTINGNGYTIKRGNGFTGTMFTVATSGELTLNNVIIDGGAVWKDAAEGDTVIYNGKANKGITSTGQLIAVNGGSLHLKGTTTLQNNARSNNNIGIDDQGSAVYMYGNTSTLTMDATTKIQNNAVYGVDATHGNSGDGAAVSIHSCASAVISGTITNNYSARMGGAVRVFQSNTVGAVTIKDAAITGNFTAGTYGAVCLGKDTNVSSTVVIRANYKDDGTTPANVGTHNNSYLVNNGLTANSEISIHTGTTDTDYGENDIVLSSASATDQGYFSVDGGKLAVVFDTGSLKLSKVAARTVNTRAELEKALADGVLTITLGGDITATETIEIPETYSGTLDLNGHTISNSTGDTITNNGNLTVTDSSDEKTGAITSTGGNGIVNLGTLTVEGGTITGNWDGISNGNDTVKNAKVTMTGGTVQGGNYAICDYANATTDNSITGGTLKNTNGASGIALGSYQTTGGSWTLGEGVSILGTISGDGDEPSTGDVKISNWNNIALSKQNDSSYKVVKGYNDLESINNAIANATGPITITLSGNVGATINIPNGKNVILDLNGYSVEGYTCVNIEASGTLTVMDSNPKPNNANGLLGSAYGIMNKGALTVNSGFIRGNGHEGIQNTAAATKCDLNGGTIQGGYAAICDYAQPNGSTGSNFSIADDVTLIRTGGGNGYVINSYGSGKGATWIIDNGVTMQNTAAGMWVNTPLDGQNPGYSQVGVADYDQIVYNVTGTYTAIVSKNEGNKTTAKAALVSGDLEMENLTAESVTFYAAPSGVANSTAQTAPDGAVEIGTGTATGGVVDLASVTGDLDALTDPNNVLWAKIGEQWFCLGEFDGWNDAARPDDLATAKTELTTAINEMTLPEEGTMSKDALTALVTGINVPNAESDNFALELAKANAKLNAIQAAAEQAAAIHASALTTEEKADLLGKLDAALTAALTAIGNANAADDIDLAEARLLAKAALVGEAADALAAIDALTDPNGNLSAAQAAAAKAEINNALANAMTALDDADDDSEVSDAKLTGIAAIQALVNKATALNTTVKEAKDAIEAAAAAAKAKIDALLYLSASKKAELKADIDAEAEKAIGTIDAATAYSGVKTAMDNGIKAIQAIVANYTRWDFTYIPTSNQYPLPAPSYYTLTFDVNGGTAVSSIPKAAGTTIDLTKYNPTREGYVFDGWYADAALRNEITSVKLAGNTTVYAGWTKIVIPDTPDTPDTSAPAPSVELFKDIFASDWYYEDVMYVCEKGLMDGTGNGMFSPAVTTTRGMIVTILYRLEGEPAGAGAQVFADVPAGEWYTEGVSWAAANGIVEGYGDGKFGPDDPITREQMATILWRYAKYKGIDVSAGESTNILSYNDAFDISEYAIPAMQWVCGEGIIGGRPGGILDPLGQAQRCEVAAILHRFCELIEK